MDILRIDYNKIGREYLLGQLDQPSVFLQELVLIHPGNTIHDFDLVERLVLSE